MIVTVQLDSLFTTPGAKVTPLPFSYSNSALTSSSGEEINSFHWGAKDLTQAHGVWVELCLWSGIVFAPAFFFFFKVQFVFSKISDDIKRSDIQMFPAANLPQSCGSPLPSGIVTLRLFCYICVLFGLQQVIDASFSLLQQCIHCNKLKQKHWLLYGRLYERSSNFIRALGPEWTLGGDFWLVIQHTTLQVKWLSATDRAS